MNDIENPQAFPADYSHEGYAMETGMTLRDYFAAKAMQAFCGDREQYISMMKDRGKNSPDGYIAEESYKMADAMLKERIEK